MKQQFANLNIRYDYPIWGYRVPLIFSKTSGWIKGTNWWFSQSKNKKHIVSSVEPAGLALSGLMEEGEWNTWLSDFKQIASEILGYKVGEIELEEVGHEPRWLNPDLAIFAEYQRVVSTQDAQGAWSLTNKSKPQLSEMDQIEIEKGLFRQEWHDAHDSIASSFQQRSHPKTAEFLYESIVGGKIPEFDYKPVSRKCVWALADIGTAEAQVYLEQLAKMEDEEVKGFANKRLASWDDERGRKGRMINTLGAPRKRIKLKPYSEVEESLPTNGNVISAFTMDDSIVVYQAYKLSIAKSAVQTQKLGGGGFSFKRMTWIKPNFLWMMYRSGWATKKDQEHILAIRIRKKDWELLLKEAVHSSYQPKVYESENAWQSALQKSEVRLQWDPSHDPYGNKLERKAIQIGIKGELMRKFAGEMIVKIEDVTRFVATQRIYVQHKQLDILEIPDEKIYVPKRKDLNIGISGY